MHGEASKGPDQDTPAVVSAFLVRYLEDHEQAAVKPLGAYQALFPGYEEVVAREYQKLQERGEPTEDPAASISFQRILSSSEHPRQIGPYKVREVVGEGGMGIVYLVEQTAPLRRRVALKLIKLGMDTREVLARFESERQALALMNHPNIARVYDAGATEQGRPFFVMEYVPGVPITQFCDRQTLKVRERLGIFLQVCGAVQHAHQKGIIHRDIKPSNVLVAFEDDKPVAKIIDFGVAKSTNQRLTEMTVYTEQGRIIGTPAYMSPEQAEMSALDVDTRTDIYSLGVLLYELLIGELPLDFDALRQAGYAEMYKSIRETDAPTPSTRLSRLGADSSLVAQNRKSDLRSLIKQLRGDLDWITLKAVEKDRSRRYASASELAADVLRHLRGELVLASPPGLGYRLGKFARRQRVALIVTLSVLLVLAAAAAVARHHSRFERIATTEKLHAGAREEGDHYRARKGELSGLEREWWRELKGRDPSRPFWEYDRELEAWARLEEARRDAVIHYNQAVISFHKALDVAPSESRYALSIQKDLERLYFERYKEALQGEVTLRPEHFKAMMDSLSLGTYQQALESGRVAISSDPVGAEVYCFRYQDREARLLPLPFSPAAAGGGAERRSEPYLEVERTWRANVPFEAGDRLLAFNGEEVRTCGRLAEVLNRDAGKDTRVRVKLLRSGRELVLSWAPFPDDLDVGKRAPRVASIRDQLGITLAGYPLETAAEFQLGVTREDAPVVVELPKGSYLFLLRKPGYRDSRFPVSVPSEEEPDATRVERIRLLKEAEIPEGFVYVPEGPACLGGDEKVDQALQRGSQRLGGFFISRHEVKAGEYLEFLNDLLASGQLDPESGRLRDAAASAKGLLVVPVYGDGNFSFELDPVAKRWKRRDEVIPSDSWPVRGVFEAAGKAYADWLTEKNRRRWTFRLPSDAEWEKAARGVDRRVYVWGNYPVWSFCRSRNGTEGQTKSPCDVGAYPMDESVFGVRDLAGSVSEPTSDETIPGYVSVRGGWFGDPTEYYYRAANRLGVWKGRKYPGPALGLRLAAGAPE